MAWEPLGWQPAWFAEIEPFPSAVLAHHWPEVQNLGDMTKIAADVLRGTVEAPDILVGGTPCQAFSVAGMRKGLDDERGQLTIKYVELLNAIDLSRERAGNEPATCVWENVPGVLSDRGNAFGCFLGALAGEDCALEPAGKRWADAGCVYGPQRAIAWRILDAQYFGLAQRRRRVFVVASAREGFDPAAVLFEREGVRRDSAPRREAGQETAGTLESRTGAGGFPGTDGTCGGHVQPVCFGGGRTGGSLDVAATLVAKGVRQDFEVETFAVQAVSYAIQAGALRTNPNSGPDGVGVQQDHAYTLEARSEVQAVAFAQNSRNELRESDISGAVTSGGGKPGQGFPAVREGMAVRRLTPEECERLQGFPVNHTRIPWRNKAAEDCPDGPRYKAIGNSKAVPVVRWLGQRLQEALA